MAGNGGKAVEDGVGAGQRLARQRFLDRALTHRANIGKPHAVGGKHACERMNEDLGHSERVGD